MVCIKKSGFTLGEVLLAVLITGIIAVLTIPSLVKGINKKARMSLLKGTMANLSNVIQSEFTKQRTTEIMNTDIYKNPKTFLDKFDSAKSGIPFASKYKKYSDLKEASDVLIPSSSVDGQAALLLKNGVGIGIVNNPENSVTYVVLDVTGDKEPNIIGADYFAAKIEWKDDYSKGIRAGDISSMENGGAAGTESNSSLVNTCKAGNGASCYRLVELSGFDPDYLE